MTLDRRTFIKVAGATAALAPMLGRSVGAAESKTITFGGSVPMSGKASDTGLNVLEGYKAAVRFLNEELGGVEIGGTKYQLDLKLFDDASDPQRAMTLIQKQLDEGTDFFLGSFSSSIVLPTAAITERARKPMVQAGGGSDQIFTRGFDYVFGMYPRASRQLISLTEMMKGVDGLKTCSLITTNDPYSRTQAEGAAKALKERGIEVLEIYKLPASVTNVSGVVSDLRSKKPDALICNTHEEESSLIVQQMASSGTSMKLLFLALGPQLPSFRSNIGKNAEGLTFLQYWDPRMDYEDPYFGSSQKYYDYYKSVSDRPETYQTVAATACILSYVQAMQNARSIEPDAVRDALDDLDFTCAYGRVKFTPDGDGDPVIMGPGVGQIVDGKVEFVYPAKIATADLEYPIAPWTER